MHTFRLLGTTAVILSLFMWHANHAFALNQNSPLLLPDQQKNDNIVNVDNSNITRKFILIAYEKVWSDTAWSKQNVESQGEQCWRFHVSLRW